LVKVLEGAGIHTLADVRALDMEDDAVIQRLVASAAALAADPDPRPEKLGQGAPRPAKLG
jgi:hypothetical protein